MRRRHLTKFGAGLMGLLMAVPLCAEAAVQPNDISLTDLEKVVESPKEKAEREARGEKLPSEVNPPVVDENDLVIRENTEEPEQRELTAVQKALQPYLGKNIVSQRVVGVVTIPEEQVLALLKQKKGMQLTEAGINEDMKSIYEAGWFFEMRPVFSNVSGGVAIIYEVRENSIYNGYTIEGNSIIPEKKIQALFHMQPGTVANLQEINKAVAGLEEEYRANGYILARVSDAHMDDEGYLRVAINEGIVEDFKVKGNVKCKDKVILREITLKKNEPFNAKKARRSMNRIQNLGFFEDVNIKLNPGQEPGAVEVEVTVKEMNTGQFGIGAGYSNADGFVGQLSIGDRNLFGSGDSASIRWEFGGRDNKNYDFTYSKPWIDKRETRMTVNLYDVTNDYEDYDIDARRLARYEKKRRGQELTFSRRAENEFISNYITLKNRDDIYNGMSDNYKNKGEFQYYETDYNVNDPKSDSRVKEYYPGGKDGGGAEGARLRKEENFGKTHSITFGRIFDNRDNVYDPHEGKRLSASVESSKGLGGDFSFVKCTVDTRYYFRAARENVWALQLMAGYAHGDMPLSQRFSMGGSDTLRGYEDNQFRGNSMLKGTLEYRFPIVKKIQGVVFTDNGYAWDKRFQSTFDLGEIKSSVGLGLRINSPLGPIKIDYGWGRDGGKFHFNFGGQF